MEWLSGSTISYLRHRAGPDPLSLLLLLTSVYFFGSDSMWRAIFVALAVLGILFLVRAPRRTAYLVLWVILGILILTFTLTVSNGPQDKISDRDEQLEYAARGFLEGKNPWTVLQPSGNPNSAGPASVLLATLPILLFDRINELTVVFYALFFVFLLSGDLHCRNGTFPILSLLFVNGLFAFRHTLFFSLDELYYGFPALALAWILVCRGSLVAAGICLAVAVGIRPSYAFPVFGFVCWYFFGSDYARAGLLKLGAGGAGCLFLLAAPFVVVLGGDLLVSTPMDYPGGLLAMQWPDSNVFFRIMNWVIEMVGFPAAYGVKIIAGLLAIGVVSRTAADATLVHPFWHVSLGSFVATLLVYLPDLLFDYMPFFVVPAFMAIAYTSSPWRFSSEAARLQTPWTWYMGSRGKKLGDRFGS